jgi:hypothetical protein
MVEISAGQIIWTDEEHVTHLCDSAEPHPDTKLIWTLCGRDVPAGLHARTLDPSEPQPQNLCPVCLAVGLTAKEKRPGGVSLLASPSKRVGRSFPVKRGCRYFLPAHQKTATAA